MDKFGRWGSSFFTEIGQEKSLFFVEGRINVYKFLMQSQILPAFEIGGNIKHYQPTPRKCNCEKNDIALFVDVEFRGMPPKFFSYLIDPTKECTINGIKFKPNDKTKRVNFEKKTIVLSPGENHSIHNGQVNLIIFNEYTISYNFYLICRNSEDLCWKTSSVRVFCGSAWQ